MQLSIFLRLPIVVRRDRTATPTPEYEDAITLDDRLHIPPPRPHNRISFHRNRTSGRRYRIRPDRYHDDDDRVSSLVPSTPYARR